MSNYVDTCPELTVKTKKDLDLQTRFSLALMAGALIAGLVFVRFYPDSKPNNTGSNPGTPTQTDRGTITPTR